MTKEIRPLLVIVKLDPVSFKSRITDEVPDIIELIKNFSKEPIELAFRSTDGFLFGYMVNTSAVPAMIRGTLEKSTRFTRKDGTFISDVGEYAAGNLFTRVGNWLDYRQRRRLAPENAASTGK